MNTRTGSATGLPNTYAVEIVAPDLPAYAAGNTGLPYVWTFDSGRSGPHMAVTALAHGHAEGVRMRDFGDFANPASPRNAVLMEYGQHWEADSIEVAKHSVTAVPRHTGVPARAYPVANA